MKRLLILLPLLLLVGCAPPADPLAYQNDGAHLMLSGQIDTVPFSAELVLAPVSAGSAVDARGFSLDYTAPDSLAGLTLSRQDGLTTLSRGEVVIPAGDDRFAGLTLPAALFCIDCRLESASVIAQNGTILNRIAAVDDEGSYTIWLDETGLPRRIEADLGGRTVIADILAVPDRDSP